MNSNTNTDQTERLETIVNDFYQDEERKRALELLNKYDFNSIALDRLKGLLEERRRLLDRSEPFYDESQLRAAAKWSITPFEESRPYYDSSSGGRDPVLATVAGKIALEGFVESENYDPRD